MATKNKRAAAQRVMGIQPKSLKLKVTCNQKVQSFAMPEQCETQGYRAGEAWEMTPRVTREDRRQNNR